MAFPHNPLSLAIPQQDLQKWYSEEVVHRFHEAASSKAKLRERSKSASNLQSSATSSSDRALRSASLDPRQALASEQALLSELSPQQQLRWEQFQQLQLQWQEPKAWSRDFLALESLPQGYSPPDTWQQANQRLRVNLGQYSGNYIRVFLIVMFCSFYKQPFAMLGMYLLWRLNEEMHRQSFLLPTGSWRLAGMRWGLYALMWVVALFFRVIFAVVAGVAVTGAAVILHGVFRADPPPRPPVRQLKSR